MWHELFVSRHELFVMRHELFVSRHELFVTRHAAWTIFLQAWTISTVSGMKICLAVWTIGYSVWIICLEAWTICYVAWIICLEAWTTCYVAWNICLEAWIICKWHEIFVLRYELFVSGMNCLSCDLNYLSQSKNNSTMHQELIVNWQRHSLRSKNHSLKCFLT